MALTSKALAWLAAGSAAASATLFWWWTRLVASNFHACVQAGGSASAVGLDCRYDLQFHGALGMAVISVLALVALVARAFRANDAAGRGA